MLNPLCMRRVTHTWVAIGKRLLGSTVTSDHFHHFKFAFQNQSAMDRVDAFLESKSMWTDLSDVKEVTPSSRSCPVKRVSAIQLAANNPLEDRWNIGLTQVDSAVSSFVCAVLDGHSGWDCSHALAWIALEYLAAVSLTTEQLRIVLKGLPVTATDTPYHLVRRLALHNIKGLRLVETAAAPPPPDVKLFFRQRLRIFVEDLLRMREVDENSNVDIVDTLTRLDSELCSLGLGDMTSFANAPVNPFAGGNFSHDILRLAQSGAVGVFGQIFWDKNKAGNRNLHLANVGDCAAVLISVDESGDFKAQPLTVAHQGGSNQNEVKRIAAEHPEERIQHLLRNGGRMLGELAPSRAFGDVRYKWPTQRLLQMAEHFGAEAPVNGSSIVPMGQWAGHTALASPYISPPYLSSRPDVTVHQLVASDRYLILATDGLWDVVTPQDAARVIQHLKPNQCPAARLVRASLTALPSKMLAAFERRRRRGELVRSEEEKEETKMATALLSLPPGTARYYRDDVTVIVIELQH